VTDSQPNSRDHSSQDICRWIVFGFLVPVQILLVGWQSCRMSPTSDEVAHLAAGVRIWMTGQIDTYLVNPPLVKAWAVIPVVLREPAVNWSRCDTTPGARPEWLIGLDFLSANRAEFPWDFVVARWMCLPFVVIGLIYCFRWGNNLFGPRAGLVAAALWCFSPDILGHGSLITPDVPATALGLATMFHVRQWLKGGQSREAIIVGLLLGLTILAKMTWLLLYGIIPILWTIRRFSIRASVSSTPPFVPSRWQLLAILVLSIDIINAGYLFDGSMQPLRENRFVSRTLGGDEVASNPDGTGNRWNNSLLGAIPVPLPKAFLAGLDLQKRDFEGGWKKMDSYLRGELRTQGWWYYYLYGALVKFPLGVWGIILCGVAILFSRRKNAFPSGEHIMEWVILLLPALMLFVFVSSQTGFSRYFRYVLPCIPFLLIAMSALWSDNSSNRRSRASTFAGWCLGAAILESLLVFPHSLAFFNVAAGGPKEGHWHLLDSNVDWGQDLYSLRDWINEHPDATPLFLSYSGVAGPELFDLPVLPIPQDDTSPLRPGWYAISVNHLHGYDHGPATARRFLTQTPVDRAGFSILIYRVTDPQ
jgi:hypothetical protein